MKSVPFESTLAFARFKDVMRKLIQVPKAELDEQVRISKENSPHKRKAKPGRSRRAKTERQ